MLSSFAQSIVFFALGAILGIYLPLALAYLVLKFRRSHFGMQMIWKVTLRLALILFLYFLLFAAFDFIISEVLQLTVQQENNDLWFSIGFIDGLTAGALLFFIGWTKAASGRIQASKRFIEISLLLVSAFFLGQLTNFFSYKKSIEGLYGLLMELTVLIIILSIYIYIKKFS